jgi:hypothetical protein
MAKRLRRSRRSTLFVAALTAGALATFPTPTSANAPEVGRKVLADAEKIRAAVDARYRRLPGRKLAVTEASSTAVVESFLLLTPDLLGLRVVPADNGIYFAICPVGALCPSPAARFDRPASDLLPRRAALELALGTFLETPAAVVAVSLPTSRVVFFIVERDELASEVNMGSLAKALRGNLARTPAPWLRRVIDQVTARRLFLILGLEPTPSGRDALGAMPLRPGAGTGS